MHTALLHRHRTCIRAREHRRTCEAQASHQGAVCCQGVAIQSCVVGRCHVQRAITRGSTRQRRGNGCCGVVDLGQTRATRQGHIQWGDAGGGGGLVGDVVVVAICTRIAAAERDSFARGHVLVAEYTGGTDCDHIIQHQTCCHQAAHRHSGGCGVVIHLIGCCDAADGQVFGCDVGGAAGLVGDAVVAHICTARCAGERDCFARAHVFVCKHTGGADAHGVATHQTGEHRIAVGHSGGCAAVVDTAVGNEARDGQGFGCDGRCGAGLVGDAVVGQVCSAVTADQCHCFARCYCLVGECAGGSQAQNIATHHAVEHRARGGHASGGVTVIDLVVGGNALHSDGLGGDIGRAAGVGNQVVIACFGARQTKARRQHRHRFAIGHLLGGKAGRIGAAVQGHRIAAHNPRECTEVADGGRQTTVIHLVGCHHAVQRDGFGGDLGRGGGGTPRIGVVGDVCAAIGVGKRHSLCGHGAAGIRHIGAGEGACSRDAQGVTCHHAIEHSSGHVHVGSVRAVVHLVVGGHARHGDGFGRHHTVGGGQAGTGTEAVVGCIRATQRQVGERVGFASARIFIRIRASAAQRHHITRHHTCGCARQRRDGGGAVVHLADGGRWRDGLDCDSFRAHHGDGVVEVGAARHRNVGGTPLVGPHIEPTRSAVSAIECRGIECRGGAVGVCHRHQTCTAGVDDGPCSGKQIHLRGVVVSQVLGLGHRVGGRCTEGMAGVGQAHQQLTRWHDGVVAVDIVKAVVIGRSTAGYQHAAVGVGVIHRTVAAADGGCGAEVAGGFAAHKACIAHTVVASGVSQAVKLGIVVGCDGERFLGDEPAQARGCSYAVVPLHTAVGAAAHTESAAGSDCDSRCAVVFAGKGAGLCQHQGVAIDRSVDGAASQGGDCRPVIRSAGHAGAADRQCFSGDGDGCVGRIEHRQAVVAGQACGGTAAAIGQGNGADVFAQGAHVCVVGCSAVVTQDLRANAAVHRDVTRQARGAIVGFGSQQRDCLGGNSRGGCRLHGECVVGSLCACQRQPRESHAVGLGHVFAVEGSTRWARDRHRVTRIPLAVNAAARTHGHTATEHGRSRQRGCGVAVVHLVVGAQSRHGDGLGRDVGCEASGLGQAVVAGVHA